MVKKIAFVVFVLVFSTCLASTFGQSENLLKKSESLAAQGDFYQALLVLEPLITADQRSHSPEQALWLANALCETVVRDGEFTKELDEIRKKWTNEGILTSRHDLAGWRRFPERHQELLKQERIAMLNGWGADIGFGSLSWNYEYRYGFLKRLLELYPDSERRPAAEYYLIRAGYNDSERVERWLNELYSYVDRNADSGVGELYAAYLDIAHINDNLWQLLTHPDGTYSIPFSSDDPEVDKEKAAKYKGEALKHYAKVIISGYGGRFGYQRWSHTKNRFHDLRRDRKAREVWIIYD